MGFSLIAPALKNVIAASDFGYDETSSVRIADLGCASGYNTIRQLEQSSPSLRRFTAAVSGSFYERLFPSSSLHIVMCNISSHWLSKTPERNVDDRCGPFTARNEAFVFTSFEDWHVTRLELAWNDMVEEELIDRETHATFCMPWFFRTIDELKFPSEHYRGIHLPASQKQWRPDQEASMDSQPPHVLAFPFPTQGHINPMILLCRKLASMGFVVTFLNIGSKNMSSTADEQFRIMSISDECLPSGRLGNNLQMYLNAMEGLRGDFETTVEELMGDSQRPPLTCILSDAFIGWTQQVANKFGICRATLWTSCATWALACFHFLSLESNGLLPAYGSSRVLDFIPGMPSSFAAKYLPDTIQNVEPYDPGFLKRRQRNEIMRNDAWVLVNSVLEVEASQIEEISRSENPNFVPIGPLHCLSTDDTRTARLAVASHSPWRQDRSCLDWLDRQAPNSVLYISFGSLATASHDQVEEILAGLDKSGSAFLWVARLDLFEDDDTRDKIVATVRNSQNSLVIPWAPQLEVLEHKSVGAFLTHCGWNSITEALAAGVPMLCKPCFGDQIMNCALVVDHLKVGLRATDEEQDKQTSAGRIEKVVRLVMGESGQELRKRAKELSDTVKRAVKHGGSSYANMQAFVEDMKRRALN
ncbi:hypothetical protein SELMODRAFT_417527 [Selaginella moellendorffii]|uniref:Uncharacterized protein n=1 Tax=Selaginella moellendorffii TaxID=88036 RepID=D8S2I8_SELML|nr:hypothetical protein SELMODRAFT_417527 [Selaginella moellendorffii]